MSGKVCCLALLALHKAHQVYGVPEKDLYDIPLQSDDDHDHDDHDDDDDHDGHDHSDGSGLIGHKIGAIVVLIIFAVVGSVLPFLFAGSKRFSKYIRWLYCLAAGLFLGLALFHLLSEAIVTLDASGIGFCIGESFVNAAYPLLMTTFLLMFYLEYIIWIPYLKETDRHVVALHSEKSHTTRSGSAIVSEIDPHKGQADDGGQSSQIVDNENPNDEENPDEELQEEKKDAAAEKSMTISVFVLLLALSVHSVFEGSVVGIAQSTSLVWISAVSIAGHKWAEGFALSCGLIRANYNVCTTVIVLTVFTLASPLGVAIGWPLSYLGDAAVGICSALAMGTLLHVAMETLYTLFRVRSQACTRHLEFLCVILGIGALFGLWVLHLSAHVHASSATNKCAADDHAHDH